MILINTSKVFTQRPENAVSKMFCNALDNIIYILNIHSMSSEPPKVSYEPSRNLLIDPDRNPVEPIRNKADTNWYQRTDITDITSVLCWCRCRMYTMNQSFPNLQTNSITRDSDILH